MTQLHYIGNGTQYLHEDEPRGIPSIPAADFETDDERVVALCLESGLYEVMNKAEAKAAEAKNGDEKRRPNPLAEAAPSEAPAQ